MIIEIDQSGKVEETAKDTVIAFAAKDGNCRSLRLPKREKRKLQKFFRDVGKPRMYTYHVFAVLVFILIRRYIRQLDRIIVDIEYPGKDNLLRDLIAEKMRVIYPEFDSSIIVFQQVEKGSMARD